MIRLQRTCLFLSMTSCIAILIFWAMTSAKWQRQRRELQKQGVPTSLAELEEYDRIPAGIADLSAEWAALFEQLPAGCFDDVAEELPVLGDGKGELPLPGEDWTSLELARNVIRIFEQELNDARSMSHKSGRARFIAEDQSAPIPDYPSTKGNVNLGRLFELSAYVHAHEGNSAQVLDDIQALLKKSAQFSGQPSAILYLVQCGDYRHTCRIIESLLVSQNWDDSTLSSLQRQILVPDFRSDMIRSIHGAQAECLAMLGKMRLGPLRPVNHSMLVDTVGSYLDHLPADWPVTVDTETRYYEWIGRVERGSLSRPLYRFSMLISPPAIQIGQAGMMAATLQRCTYIALACRRHQLHHGTFPGSLAEIDSRCWFESHDPGQMLVDPFNGDQLKFAMAKEGVTLYSVGINRTDEGGKLESTWGAPDDYGLHIRIPFALSSK